MTLRVPSRPRIRLAHAAGGALAILLIAGFFLSTVVVELTGSRADIAATKKFIVYLLPVLVCAMAVAGASGFALASKPVRGRAAMKQRRMSIIAPNGLLILIPAALFLSWKASDDAFDTAFYLVQSLELLAGATNLLLLGLNVRDGLMMTGRLRPKSRASAA